MVKGNETVDMYQGVADLPFPAAVAAPVVVVFALDLVRQSFDFDFVAAPIMRTRSDSNRLVHHLRWQRRPHSLSPRPSSAPPMDS